MPASPISEKDAWQIVRMLRNVKDHETFMRFIGAPEADLPVKRPTSSVTKSKTPQRRPRTKKRATKR